MAIKEKLKNAKEKAVKFCAKHKKAIIGTLAGAGAIGLGWYGIKKLHGENEESAEIGMIPENVGGQTIEDMIGETEEKSEWELYDDRVREERADDFKKMFEFVDNDFDVKDDEAWMIVGPKHEYASDSGTIDIYLIDDGMVYIKGDHPALEEPKELEEP